MSNISMSIREKAERDYINRRAKVEKGILPEEWVHLMSSRQRY